MAIALVEWCDARYSKVTAAVSRLNFLCGLQGNRNPTGVLGQYSQVLIIPDRTDLNMLEYIFFDERPWRRFFQFTETLGLTPEISHGDEGWLVALPEDIDDDQTERIEAYYTEMFELDQRLYAESGEEKYNAGIGIDLADGRRAHVLVDPDLLSRLLTAVSPEELGEFVNTVASAVENPDETPLCRR